MAENDQITVDLVAKTDQYNQALNSAASSTEAFGSRVSRATDGAKAGLDKLGVSVGDLSRDFAGAFLGAISVEKIIDLGARSIETADKLNKMSQQVGIATDTLSALQAQAQLSDVGFDQFGTAMERLARSATAAAGGAQQQVAAYQAMGVSVTNAAGQMRPMSDILQDVAKKMAGYEDGASKTALAQQLFGRTGAALIPLLNQLGEQGFAKVREEAEKYNQVIGPEQARQSEEFHDNITRLQQATSGFANAVMRELLPGLVNMTDQWAQSATTSDGYASSARTVAGLITELINDVRDLGHAMSTIPQQISDAAKAFDDWAKDITGTSKALRELLDLLPKVKQDTNKGLLDFPGAESTGFFGADAVHRFLQRLNTPTAGSVLDAKMLQAATKPLQDFDNTLQLTVKDVDTASTSLGGMAQHVDMTGVAAAKAQAPVVKLGTAAEDAGKQARELDAAMDRLDTDLDKLSAKMAGPYVQAQSAYNATVRQLQNDAEAAAIAGGNVTEIIRKWQEAETLAGAALGQTLAQIREEHDLFAQQETDYKNLMQVLQVEPQYRDVARAALQKYDDLMKSHYDFYGNYIQDENDLRDALDEQLPKYVQAGERIQDVTQAEKLNQDVTHDWINIWQQAGDQLASTFASILVNGGSLFQALTNLAKQTVSQIIEYFLKLAVINPILNAIFGTAITGGAGLLPTLANAGVSAATGSSGGGAGIMDYVSGGQSAYGAYGWLTGAGGSQTAAGSLFGTGDFDVGWGNSLSAGGGMGGALGTAGGVFGGYYLGQKYLGGTAGGIAGAAGLGAAAYFVPIIGWIAGAIALIDMMTGGGLLGTDANKLVGGGQSVSIGAGGADVASHYTLKGKKPLFGGSYYEEHSYVDQQALDAWNQFFQMLTTSNANFAKKLGEEAGEVAAGTFAQTFDKKGNITGSTTTIAGHTYSGETAQQFQEREIAETMVNTMSQMDAALSASVDQYRANADQFYAIVQQLGNAAIYMHNGGQFLALGSDQSLSALLKLAQGAQQFGESIDQTIQRLMQAQAQYDQFVGQFKPAATYVDSFEATLAGINDQMNQNIATANALAQAAGASGASEQDLANIHRYAAQQMAQAIMQLEASAQGLAFSLGLTSIGSLDAVNQEIAQLQARANAGGHAVRGFGDAMQAAAQRATDAMNLLLGDLSPLNDAEKLQKALVGLRSGTATQEQVLAIGRRLYASSQAYTDLFNQVMAMGPGHAGTGGSQFAQAGGSGLSAADSARLRELEKEKKQLESAQQFQQYQLLAQQIAEIASAKGEDWQQVVSDMGIDLKAFEKGLGMNDAQLDAYIKNFQSLKDSNGENTKSIIAVLNAILVQLGGTPIGDSGGDTGGTGSGSTPRGHSGHGGVRDPRVDQIMDGFARIMQQQPRSGRQRGTVTIGGA